MTAGQTAAGVRAEPALGSPISARLAAAERIVVKVGTSVLLRDDGSLALGPLASLIDSIASLRRSGCDVLLVSSGAVGLGAERLALGAQPSTVTMKQACAAVGQSRLMAVYEDGFARLGLATAQLLLTDEDLADPRRRESLRDAVEALFQSNAIPVVNENDTVSMSRLECDRLTDQPAHHRSFHDNDMLAALMARTIGASVLLLLSDVDGLYTANPRLVPSATLISVVPAITTELVTAANGGSARGRGGMAGKLAAARAATDAGVLTIIANGRRPNVIDNLWAGVAAGTTFLPATHIAESPR